MRKFMAVPHPDDPLAGNILSPKGDIFATVATTGSDTEAVVSLLRDALNGNTVNSEWVDNLQEDHAATYQGTLPDDVFFALGLAGEVGETINFMKKEHRDGVTHQQDIHMEMADSLVYLIMLASSRGISFDELLKMAIHKHNVYRERKGLQ